MKSLSNCFLGDTVTSVFKIGVGGTTASIGGGSGRLTGSCLGGSVWDAHSVGRFSIRGRCMAGVGRGSSAIVCRGLSGSVLGVLSLCMMHHSGVPLAASQI